MGCSYHVKCLQCGDKFKVNSGGGFFFHCLHCDLCGADKSISFEEIGEAHSRYVKGLPGPYCVVSSNIDRHIQENYPGESMSEEEYHTAVEQIAGGCGCGGSYKFDAPPRCPKCRSAELEYDPQPSTFYD
jgi:hypothetical protein